MVPESVIWILSSRCNLSCKHCYTARFPKKIFEKRVYEDVLSEILSLEVNSIGFTGGEPLLFPYLKDLLGMVRDVPRVTIATNGLLIDKEWVSLFSQMKNLHIYLSLDGLKESHEFLRGSGTFQGVLRSMELLEEAGVNHHVMMAIGSFNYKESGEVVKIVFELSAQSFSLIPIMPTGRAKGTDLIPTGYQVVEAVERAYQASKDLPIKVDVWCAPFVKRFLDLQDLTVASCRLLSNVDISPTFDLLLCDVIDVKVSNILEEGGFLKALEKFSDMDPDPVEACRGCSIYNFCLGGCFARAYMEKGVLNAPDPLCPFQEGGDGKRDTG